MSQREGAPRSKFSQYCLRLIACFTCKDPPSEWQLVWNGREELHHDDAPAAEGKYKGHSCRLDLVTHELNSVRT